MTSKEFRDKIVVGHILVDDVGQVYEVVEKFENSVATSPFPNPNDYSCEIITFRCMENEGWKIDRKVLDA